MSNTKANLDEFFDLVDDIPNRNHGGCLFFAYVFWLWLKINNMPTDTFQIVQYGWYDAIRQNLDWINGDENEAGSSAHFTWIYEGIEYDSEGEFDVENETEDRQVLHGLNTGRVELVDEFCENALNNGDWNWDFDRASAIELCEKRFEIDLSDVDYYGE